MYGSSFNYRIWRIWRERRIECKVRRRTLTVVVVGSNITRSLYQKVLAVWVMSRVFYSFARPRAARCWRTGRGTTTQRSLPLISLRPSPPSPTHPSSLFHSFPLSSSPYSFAPSVLLSRLVFLSRPPSRIPTSLALSVLCTPPTFAYQLPEPPLERNPNSVAKRLCDA